MSRSACLSTFEPIYLAVSPNQFPFCVQNERIFLKCGHLCHLPLLENFPSCPCRQEAHVFPCYHRRTLAMFLGWHSQSSGLMVYIRR